MIVTRINLIHFMSHAATQVELPTNGLVLVRGNNGAGKSSLVEGASVALWGKTLRGDGPWCDGQDGQAGVVIEGGLWSLRARSKSGYVSLGWGFAGKEASKYETTTKAQHALEQVVGSFDAWRRTHVLSSQDAAHFTSATDGERKRLLEALLGLDSIDPAAERANDARRVAERARLEAVTALKLSEQAIEIHERALDEIVDTPEIPEVTESDLDEIREEIEQYRSDVAESQTLLETQYRRQQQAKANAFALNKTREEERERFAQLSGVVCPTCEQPVELARARVEQEILSKKEKLDEAYAQYQREQVDASAGIVALSKRIRDSEEELVRARARLHMAMSAREARTLLEKETARAKNKLLTSLDQDDVARAQHTAARAVEAEAEIVARVLGLGGVRAHMLSEALAGIEAVANRWLARIAGAGLVLELRPYAEKAAGGIRDAIGLKIHGAGGGRGYRAASGGERRRIDVALLLALAEVSAAARAQPPGTLWLDEVFDALDADGIDAVSAALHELGTTRPVVVITHSEILAQRLERRAVLRLRVEQGKVTHE